MWVRLSACWPVDEKRDAYAFSTAKTSRLRQTSLDSSVISGQASLALYELCECAYPMYDTSSVVSALRLPSVEADGFVL